MKNLFKFFCLWLATKLLWFMEHDTCLVRVMRYNGDIEWDGAFLEGTRVIPVGLNGLVEK